MHSSVAFCNTSLQYSPSFQLLQYVISFTQFSVIHLFTLASADRLLAEIRSRVAVL